MTWKAMTPAEACDLMDFWAGVAWPLTRDEVQRLAVERFGWTIEVEDGTPYLMNTVSGFTVPDVSTIGARKQLAHLRLDLADEAPKDSAQDAERLSDAFTLFVREGASRWGDPALREREGTKTASWDAPNGGRISFSASDRTLSGMFETPHGVAVERKLGY